MSDVILSTGKEITFDFHCITFREWRGLFSKDEPEEISDANIARVGGLTYDDLLDMSYADHYLYMQEFWKRAKDPLKDPKNLPSAPSSP